MADSKLADTASSQDFDESTRYFGRVKWFKNKAGYGFCTVVGDEGDDRVGEDIFVHHTGVKVASEQYKYCLLYTSPSPRDGLLSRMPSSA